LFGPFACIRIMLAENGMPEQPNDRKLRDLHMASIHLQERREVRYAVAIDIEVSGIDQDGEAFHERTTTRNVSEWGCGFLLSVELKPDDIVALRIASSKNEFAGRPQSLFQVLRVMPEEGRWLVGAWKVDEGNVWGVDLEKVAKAAAGTRESRKEGSSARVKRPPRGTDR
jgi:hypothetical protein